MPFTEERLLDGSGTATASPFVIAIENAGIHALPSIVNSVILLSSFSAGNSYLYAASRTLYGLACDKQAPAIFSRVTKSGLPIFCVAVTVMFGALAYMNVSTNGEVVFNCERGSILIGGGDFAEIANPKCRVLHTVVNNGNFDVDGDPLQLPAI